MKLDHYPPPDLLPEPAATRLRELHRLHDDLTAAFTALREAELALPAAEEQDLDLAADAHRAGRKQPGPTNSTKARAAIDDARRAHAVIQRAIDDTTTELDAAITDASPTWTAALDAGLADHASDLGTAVDRLDDARRILATTRKLLSWLEHPGRYNPGAVAPVSNLVGVNGDPASWSSVVDALRAEAQPVRVVIEPRTRMSPMPRPDQPPSPLREPVTVD